MAAASPLIYTLSLHDALPISDPRVDAGPSLDLGDAVRLVEFDEADRVAQIERSEEHTSELQSHSDLVCRLLLEKKKTHGDSKRRASGARTLTVTITSDSVRR